MLNEIRIAIAERLVNLALFIVPANTVESRALAKAFLKYLSDVGYHVNQED